MVDIRSFIVVAGAAFAIAQCECPTAIANQETQPHSDAAMRNYTTQLPERWRDMQRQGLLIPPAIGVTDVRVMSRILVLSPAQLAYVEYVLADYATMWNAIESEGAPRLLQLLRELSKFDSLQWEYQNLSRELNDARVSLLAELRRVDDGFFVDLRAVLAPEQLENLSRVIDYRRRGWSADLQKELPVSRVDLYRLCDQVGLDEVELAAVDKVLREYEAKVTPLFVQLDALLRSRIHASVEMRQLPRYDDAGIAIDRNSPEYGERLQMARQRLTELYPPCAELQEEIAETNDRYVRTLCGILAPDRAGALMKRYRELCYPRILPDSTDPKPAFEAMCLPSMKEQAIHDAANVIWENYRLSYDRLCDEMMVAFVAHQMERAQFGGNRDPGRYRAKMQQLRDARWAENEKVVSAILSILPGNEYTPCRDALGISLERIGLARKRIELNLQKGIPDLYPEDQ